MEPEYDIILTGSDGPVEGIAHRLDYNDGNEAYEFNSVDETIQLIIAKQDGQWIRIAGSDPYFTGWPDELAEQILIQKA